MPDNHDYFFQNMMQHYTKGTIIAEFLKAVESYNMNRYKQIRTEQLENVTSHIQRGLDSATTYFKSSVDAITLYYDHQPTRFMNTIIDYRYVCFCADLVDEL